MRTTRADCSIYTAGYRDLGSGGRGMSQWVLFDGFAWMRKSQVQAVLIRRMQVGVRVCVLLKGGNEFAGRVLPDKAEAEASMSGFMRQFRAEPAPYRDAV